LTLSILGKLGKAKESYEKAIVLDPSHFQELERKVSSYGVYNGDQGEDIFREKSQP